MDNKPSRTDSPHWAGKPFQRNLLYLRTSESYRIEHQSNETQNYNEQKIPVSWWVPFDDVEETTNQPNTTDYRFESFDDEYQSCVSPNRSRPVTHSSSRVSFSPLDDVRVFYPDMPEIKFPSGNPRPKKLTIEDNILRIGDVAIYRGRLGERVDVMSRISDVSSRNSILSPDITSPSPSTERHVDDRNNKTSREVSETQVNGGRADLLPPLKKVPRQPMKNQKTTPVSHAALATSSCGVDTEREKIRQMLSTKPRRQTRTAKSNAPVRGIKLPAISQSNAVSRGQKPVCGQGERRPCNLPYLPAPPTCPRKGRTNSRRKYQGNV